MLQNNRTLCKKDGLCVAICPVSLIEEDSEGFPVLVEDGDERCIRCGHCVAVCPAGCLQHRDLPANEFIPIDGAAIPSQEQCRQFLKGRRSIRNFKDKAVPQEVVAQLLDVARYAPSGHNSQCVEWLVLGNRKELNSLSALVVDWMKYMIVKMPEIAGPLHMDAVIERWNKGEDVLLRDAPMVIVAHAGGEDRMAPVSCTLGLAYLELAASGLNLGACWAGYFNGAATSWPPMQKALQIPEGNQAYGAMMIGYPKLKFKSIPPRKAVRAIYRL